ncbi:hypothetical protein Fcan01_17791 [Folsomia candida]|uniref:Uncharacterized protein n=1 Tax=Folsomia candida TaxID=158441 RepID=A0A226DQI7_FOLCA|nr:hypothetical protein Fcan01_17791 [Folsomia candida]
MDIGNNNNGEYGPTNVYYPVTLYFSSGARYRNGTSLFDPMTFTDAMFVANDNDFVCMISYAFVSDGIINLVKLRAHFEEIFVKDGKHVKFPVFHSTFAAVLGYSFRIRMRVPLDLNLHIREEEYDGNISVETENEALSRISHDKSNLQGPVPKWEIVLLHNTHVRHVSHGSF